MSAHLKYLSDRSISQLRKEIPDNISRYRGDGFTDLADEPGWDVPLGVEFDADLLSQLDLSQPQHIAPIDLKNSTIVGKALSSLDPSTANEERVWVRLAHVEAFEYSRARWIGSAPDEDTRRGIKEHLMALL